jgi:CubicO group peptidase (beta-lactamase class C family)
VDAWMQDAINVQKKLPCVDLIVSQKGRVVCEYHNKGVATTKGNGDMIYRMYSMTKPVVTIAAMILLEEGRFQLDQPVYKYLGDKWKKENMKVVDLAQTAATKSLVTVPCNSDITLDQLITHTSGLSHGLSDPRQGNVVDAYYADKKISGGECILLEPKETGLPNLQAFCDTIVACPLLYQPGEHWQYSYGLEVMGRIIEMISGSKDLNEFVQERICKKLGMCDTTFFLNQDQELRLCPFYFAKNGFLLPEPTHFPSYCSGSAGLFSTMNDYHLLCRMLLRGGVGDNGQRILSPRTVEWMMENHLRRDARPIAIKEMSIFDFNVPSGLGFGYGGAVFVDSGYPHLLVSKGEYSWAGATSTNFWIDPEEEIVVVFMTSVFEDDKKNFPITAMLHSLVYGALDETTGHPKPAITQVQ